jgi:hypothetical protein
MKTKKYKIIPDEKTTATKPTLEEYEQEAGHPLLAPEFRNDAPMRKIIVEMLQNAITIDALNHTNRNLFLSLAQRAIELTPKFRQDAVAQAYLAAGIAKGYISRRDVEAGMEAIFNERGV